MAEVTGGSDAFLNAAMAQRQQYLFQETLMAQQRRGMAGGLGGIGGAIGGGFKATPFGGEVTIDPKDPTTCPSCGAPKDGRCEYCEDEVPGLEDARILEEEIRVIYDGAGTRGILSGQLPPRGLYNSKIDIIMVVLSWIWGYAVGSAILPLL